jgi:four helix bundle protein
MTKISNSKPKYDLEERTFQYARDVRLFIKTLPKTVANIEDGKQVVKSSGSAGANYREANEALSKKRFFNESKNISKESEYFLRLINETNKLTNAEEARRLIREATELKKIFPSIIEKSK